MDEITRQLNEMKEAKEREHLQNQPVQQQPAQPQNIPPQQTKKKKSTSSCWLPIGCMGGIILIAGFIISIVIFVFGVMKSSAVYKTAYQQASQSPGVIEILGEPIDDGLMVSGNIKISGSSGYANINFPISGPKGKATVHATANKNNEKWTFQQLVVEIEGKDKTINLLP